MESSRARLFVASLLMLSAAAVFAARESNIRQTPHNLSAAGPGTVKATSESQVCGFCHTPHGATSGLVPLWNRQTSGTAYTPYDSSSLDAKAIQLALQQPGGSSKLCLSCHDGLVAIGNVNVLNGQANTTVSMTGTDGGRMPAGSGTTTGYTRVIGADLTNDHPISIDYTTALADRDGELRRVDMNQRWGTEGSRSIVARRNDSARPHLPLEPTGTGNVSQLQCGTCHDPHIRETDATKGNQKFLRLNRFQEADPRPGTSFSTTNDIICLGCHDKNLTNGIWAYSAHANPAVATQLYKPAEAQRRQFPSSLDNPPNSDIPVWKASCLNCHDTHTVQGSRRLLREGTDALGTPKAAGNPAIEETCYQCHNTAAASILQSTTTVPNVYSDFQLARRMPIRATPEVHDISSNFTDAYNLCNGPTNMCGADMIEPRSALGAGNLGNRHAECSDCHNPHRVVKFRNFAGKVSDTGVITPGLNQPPDTSGTHLHLDQAGFIHTNIISGVLRGAWGVEPIYTNASFHEMPSSFLVKRGDPGSSNDTTVTAGYVTREYQICLKCHSNYGYNDDNLHPNSANRPQLGGTGLTPVARTSDPRNHTSYTNQAKEFQAPAGHAVNVGSVSAGTEAGAAAPYNANNHRSWHPVMRATGRTSRATGGFRAPWNNTGAMGVQTMYCSDCHGSDTGAQSAIPDGNSTTPDGNPWGPHGSTRDWLLKGIWNTATGEGQQTDGICFKCHNYSNYAVEDVGGTGWQTTEGDGHSLHSKRIDTAMKCNFCHVAVPHGWKNRGLLVNLRDIGQEVGQTPGTVVSSPYTNGPYYRRAYLRVFSFPSPGSNWSAGDCGGRDFMRSTCETGT